MQQALSQYELDQLNARFMHSIDKWHRMYNQSSMTVTEYNEETVTICIQTNKEHFMHLCKREVIIARIEGLFIFELPFKPRGYMVHIYIVEGLMGFTVDIKSVDERIIQSISEKIRTSLMPQDPHKRDPDFSYSGNFNSQTIITMKKPTQKIYKKPINKYGKTPVTPHDLLKGLEEYWGIVSKHYNFRKNDEKNKAFCKKWRVTPCTHPDVIEGMEEYWGVVYSWYEEMNKKYFNSGKGKKEWKAFCEKWGFTPEKSPYEIEGIEEYKKFFNSGEQENKKTAKEKSNAFGKKWWSKPCTYIDIIEGMEEYRRILNSGDNQEKS